MSDRRPVSASFRSFQVRVQQEGAARERQCLVKLVERYRNAGQGVTTSWLSHPHPLGEVSAHEKAEW